MKRTAQRTVLRTGLVVVSALAVLLTIACAQLSPRGDGSPTLNRIIEKGELRVGMAGNMPPMNMTTKTGELIGMEVDIAEVLAGALGVELKLVTLDFAELLPALEAGKLDMVMSSMTMTPKRNIKVAFVGPYFASGKGLLTKLKTLVSITDPSAIDGPNTRLVALAGSTSEQFVKVVVPKARLVTTKNYDDAVRMVIQDKVDAMVADFPFCAVTVIRNPGEGLLPLVSPLTYEPIGIALPAGDPHLINWTQNYLNTLANSGDLTRINLNWFGRGEWLDQLP